MNDTDFLFTKPVSKASEDFDNRPWYEFMGRSKTSFKSLLIKGFMLAMFSTTETRLPQAVILNTKRFNESTETWHLKILVGRRISRAEAIAITQNILEKAEREREDIAKVEARDCLIWGEL